MKAVEPAPPSSRSSRPFTAEALEQRQLLSATVAAPIANTFVSAGAPASAIDLTGKFSEPGIALVHMDTTAGPIDLQLNAAAAPKNVANFLRYVNAGLYNGVLIHRAIPGFIVQGGGFLTNGQQYQTFAPVQGEPGPATSNVAGTIAMALGTSSTTGQTDPNSGTDEWFVNLADNSSTLDPMGFTAFGTVINNTLSTLQTIANLPKTDASSLSPAFGPDPAANGVLDFPVLQGGQNGNPPSLDPSNLVVVQNTTQLPVGFTYSATSDNAALVAPTVSGSTLSLTYPSSAATGVAHITVTALEANGSSVSQTFLAAVGSMPVSIGTGTAAARGVVFTDAAGHKQTIALTGPGSANVVFSGTNVAQTTNKNKTVTITATGGASVSAIATTGTTARSTLKVTGPRGSTLDVSALTTDAPLASISAPGVRLTGPLAAAGSVGKIDLASLNGGTLALNGAAARTTLTLGPVTNSTITASAALSSITVRGDVTNSTFSFTAPNTVDVAKISVSGALANSPITAAGSLGAVTADSAAGSRIYAGVTPSGGAALPTTAAEFTAGSQIAALRLRSDAGTDVAASTLGNLSLGSVTTANGGTHFGVAARSLTSLTAKLSTGGRLNVRRVTSSTDLATQLTKEKINLSGTDFVLDIV